MARNALLLAILIPALMACAQFPELDTVVSEEAKNAPPPQLKPVDQVLADAQSVPAQKGDSTEEELRARAAALQARANRLRQQ